MRAHILVDGKLFFTTGRGYPIFTEGQSNAVALLLRRAAPPPRQVADCRFRTEGKVRAMHPEFGMGVEFASKTKDHRRLMEAVIRRLTLSHDPSPGCWLSRKDLIGEIEAKSCRKIHPFPQHGNR